MAKCRCRANLIGESIFFSILSDQNTFIENEKVKVVAVKALGWKILKWENDNGLSLENVENKPFGHQILILVEIQEQSIWKGRNFKIYNRNSTLFETTMQVEDDYEFTRFDPELPTRFKTKAEANSYEDLLDLCSDSKIISEQIIKNKIKFRSWLKGKDYNGSNSFKGLIPEKIIEFNYTYDYQEDINKRIAKETKKATKLTLDKIVVESKRSMRLALVLFGLSIVLWFISMHKVVREFFCKLFETF